jgi:hypothetical protein
MSRFGAMRCAMTIDTSLCKDRAMHPAPPDHQPILHTASACYCQNDSIQIATPDGPCTWHSSQIAKAHPPCTWHSLQIAKPHPPCTWHSHLPISFPPPPLELIPLPSRPLAAIQLQAHMMAAHRQNTSSCHMHVAGPHQAKPCTPGNAPADNLIKVKALAIAIQLQARKMAAHCQNTSSLPHAPSQAEPSHAPHTMDKQRCICCICSICSAACPTCSSAACQHGRIHNKHKYNVTHDTQHTSVGRLLSQLNRNARHQMPPDLYLQIQQCLLCSCPVQ